VPGDSENDALIDKHFLYTFYSVVNSSMHTIHTQGNDAKHDMANWLIRSEKT